MKIQRSGEIPRKLNAVVLAGGGRSFTQATVESLLMDGRKCIGVKVNGIDVKAKIVVSGIGAYRSYEKLVKPLSDPYLSKCATRAMERIEKTTELTVAFIFLFIGLDISGQPEEERDTRSHNTLPSPPSASCPAAAAPLSRCPSTGFQLMKSGLAAISRWLPGRSSGVVFFLRISWFLK